MPDDETRSAALLAVGFVASVVIIALWVFIPVVVAEIALLPT